MDAVLTAVLGGRARVTAVLAGDGGAEVRAVTGAAGEPLVVKTAPAGAAPDLLRAAHAQEAARRAGVPVPRTVAARVVDGTQVHVTEHVPGSRWSDVHPSVADATRRAVQDALVDVLARLRGVAPTRVSAPRVA
ncbi:phosphotransferase [Cellulomonas sp. GbtcB1]|uniref:phosphotransferase n=1 Tax=Cellulomonas sp. GbtcB1 TaxID=2824746 RepID=UPI001C3038F7|nr:phosphotransferase [Cellulomonas sp. GbtcB1]